jgi:indolepyruvate ferredoxin oxidoreductase beta subunit
MTMERVWNIKIAGLGGMGILKSSAVLAEVLFKMGYDVKKAEVHGMSQRGGSVASDLRFGREVFSPMIPDGETDYLLLVAPEVADIHRTALREGGVVIRAEQFEKVPLANRKSLNMAMLGALSQYLDVPDECWIETIRAVFPEKLRAVNEAAFTAGRGVEGRSSL